MNKRVEEVIKSAPAKSGVYLFKDKRGSVLYVGKAKNLRSRLRSYLSPSVPHKISVMLKKAEDLELITTDTELNAFILENNLIKTHRPPFNVMLKDDKNYPYIKVALKDPFPYIEVVRRVEKDGSLYYGPYVPAWMVRETLKTITESFPIRRCKRDLTRAKANRPCLNHQMGKCLAPCCGEVSQKEYMRVVEEVVQILEGRGDELVARLERQMKEAAERLEFERAARIRDKIAAIKRVSERQRVLLKERVDADVIGMAEGGKTLSLCVLFVRRGMVIGEKAFFFEDTPKEEAMDALFRELYLDSPSVPPLIIAPEGSGENWRDILKAQIPQEVPTEFKDVLAFANQKAREHLSEHASLSEAKRKVLEEAARVLGLKRPPVRIEGYDISNTSGGEAVGSMVVFEEGEPAKSLYRRFRVRLPGPDDYAMHEEVMRRRVSHEEWGIPDLILVDGGPGQLRRVEKVVKEAGWKCDVLAISKGKDRDHIWCAEGEKDVEKGSPVYLLLQRVRDESHRFALSYHRRLREKGSLSTELESIRGVGPKRRDRILKFLASIQPRIPSPEEVSRQCSIPLSIAASVVELVKQRYKGAGGKDAQKVRKAHR